MKKVIRLDAFAFGVVAPITAIAASLILVLAASKTMGAPVTKPALSFPVADQTFIKNVVAKDASGKIVLSWTLHDFGYPMQLHVTRTPTFSASDSPSGYASFSSPTSNYPDSTRSEPFTFTHPDAKPNVTYSYTVCAFGPNLPSNQSVCSQSITAHTTVNTISPVEALPH